MAHSVLAGEMPHRMEYEVSQPRMLLVLNLKTCPLALQHFLRFLPLRTLLERTSEGASLSSSNACAEKEMARSGPGMEPRLFANTQSLGSSYGQARVLCCAQ
jgi:hypothetical protein